MQRFFIIKVGRECTFGSTLHSNTRRRASKCRIKSQGHRGRTMGDQRLGCGSARPAHRYTPTQWDTHARTHALRSMSLASRTRRTARIVWHGTGQLAFSLCARLAVPPHWAGKTTCVTWCMCSYACTSACTAAWRRQSRCHASRQAAWHYCRRWRPRGADAPRGRVLRLFVATLVVDAIARCTAHGCDARPARRRPVR